MLCLLVCFIHFMFGCLAVCLIIVLMAVHWQLIPMFSFMFVCFCVCFVDGVFL